MAPYLQVSLAPLCGTHLVGKFWNYYYYLFIYFLIFLGLKHQSLVTFCPKCSF